MIKHHLVQILPVAVNARFCVKESFSAGRKKSLTPARTRAHFITGALHQPNILISALDLPKHTFWPTKRYRIWKAGQEAQLGDY